jgi:glyoxylase-like metal-dependent hydrolase (beta-lactamase superfamily II)/8-oxo-dGTP pyrophosphatase MutT (NUDIX family)
MLGAPILPFDALTTPSLPRPAATLVVVRDGERGLEVLLMHRTKTMDFGGGAHVFPGGAVDPSDAALAPACVGLDDAAASRRLEIASGGLAYWICAIRECFEEAGLLYAYAGDELVRFDAPVEREDAPSLRRALNAGETTFAAMIETLGVRLATDRLAYLSHWITQAGRPRRYDTRFFIAAAPARQRPMHDEGETVAHDWVVPRSALERHARGEIELMFPTLKTLELLAKFDRIADALDFAHTPRPMPPMSPRLASGRDGPKLLVPGDYAYAEVGKLDPDGKGTAAYEILPGVPVPIAPRIVRLTAPNPGMMTGPGTNTYLLGDAASGIAVIDPGPAIDAHVQAIAEAAAGPIRWILCTHTHIDHSPAAAPLKARTGATVLGMRARYPERQDATFAPDRELTHGERLEVGGCSLRVLHTPGHASNQLCFLEESERLLFTGDHLMQGSTVVINPPDGDMAVYLASLRLLLDEALEYIAPGHGFLMGRPHEMVERVLVHRVARENKVLAALAAHGPEALDNLVPHVYDDVPARMHPVASRSLLAHLIKLREEGRAVEAESRWRIARS